MKKGKEVTRLVKMSLAFHNLNKAAEAKLGLSLVQYHLLTVVRDMPGSSSQVLAKAVGMHPSSLTQSMKRMQKKHCLFVGEDPRDSRKKIISLTFSGKKAMEDFEAGIAELMEKGIVEGLPCT